MQYKTCVYVFIEHFQNTIKYFIYLFGFAFVVLLYNQYNKLECFFISRGIYFLMSSFIQFYYDFVTNKVLYNI